MKGNNVLSNKHDLECDVTDQLYISLLSMELCKYFDITDFCINGLENMNHINVSVLLAYNKMKNAKNTCSFHFSFLR